MNRNFVEQKLLELGFPARIKGFTYIADVIMLIDENNSYDIKMMWLYHVIAKKNGTVYANVERAIRSAFETVRKHNINSEKIQHYMGLETQNKNSLFQMHMTFRSEFDDLANTVSDKITVKELILQLANQYGYKIAVLN